jgi:murein DD-endopeptidase MepM/ murein hydrolase activator NlpD
VVGKVVLIGVGLVLAVVAGADAHPASAQRLVGTHGAFGAHPARPGSRAPASAGEVGGPVEYQAPLPLPLQIVRRFDPPLTPFGPGHLGVDLAVPGHTPIRSAGPGVVSFAGPVAGRGVVVVSHRDGVRTEYEPVQPLVRRGDLVQPGTPIGVLAGRHPGCPVTSCLHWGARRGAEYIDPLALLTPPGSVRLLPWEP